MPKTMIMYKNITKVLVAFIFIASMGKQHAASASYTYILNGKEYAYTPSREISDIVRKDELIFVYTFYTHKLQDNAKKDTLERWWLWSCFFNIIHTTEVKYTIQNILNNKPDEIIKDWNKPETRTRHARFSSQIEVNLGQGDQLKKVTIVLEYKFKKRSIFYIAIVSVIIQFLWNHRNALWQDLYKN